MLTTSGVDGFKIGVSTFGIGFFKSAGFITDCFGLWSYFSDLNLRVSCIILMVFYYSLILIWLSSLVFFSANFSSSCYLVKPEISVAWSYKFVSLKVLCSFSIVSIYFFLSSIILLRASLASASLYFSNFRVFYDLVSVVFSLFILPCNSSNAL